MDILVFAYLLINSLERATPAPQDPGVYLMEFHGLRYIQVPKTWPSPRMERTSVPQYLAWASETWEVRLTVKTEANKNVEYFSLYSVGCCQFSCPIYRRGTFSLTLFFVANVPVNPFLFFAALAKLGSKWDLAFLMPLLHIQKTSHILPRINVPYSSPAHFLLTLQFIQEKLSKACWCSAFLPDFLHVEIKNCALKKKSLKSCQLFSDPFSLKAVS